MASIILRRWGWGRAPWTMHRRWDFTPQNLEFYAPKLGILRTKTSNFTRQNLGFYAPKLGILRAKTWDFRHQTLGFYAPKLGILRKKFGFYHQNLGFHPPKFGILRAKTWDFTFISHLASWLRTRRFSSLLFDPPEPQIIGKTQCFATFLPFRAPGSSFS